MSYSKRYREHTIEYRQAEHSLEAAHEVFKFSKSTIMGKAAADQEEIKDIPLEKIAYVDESGIDTYLYREYGYALRGQQAF